MDTGGLILLLATAAVVGAYALVAVVLHPRRAALLLIPVMAWPTPPVVVGIPVTFAAVALVFLGVMLSSRAERSSQGLLWAFGGFAIATAASVLLHGPSVAMLPTEARNSATALVLAAALVPVYAKAGPTVDQVIRWLAVSLAVASGYLALTGTAAGGRLVAETTNSNSAGYAATAGLLACALAVKASRHYVRWAVVAVPALYVLYAAQSRGALTALVAGIIVGALIGLDGPRRLAATAFGIAALILLWGPLAAFASDVLLAERSARFVESDSRRLVLELAWASFRESPFGIGYGHFLDVSRPYLGFPLNTHNDWVRLFVEGGFALGILALVLVPSRLFVRGLDAKAMKAKVLLSAGCVAALFSNSMTDLRVSAPVFICAGLLWSAAQRRQIDETEVTPSRRQLTRSR